MAFLTKLELMDFFVIFDQRVELAQNFRNVPLRVKILDYSLIMKHIGDLQ